MKNKTALIIDCANVGWAGSYAFSYMLHNEEHVGVLYNILYQILKFTEVLYPDYVLFAWDSMKSRRKLLYPLYKQKDEIDMSEEKMIMKQQTEHQLDLLRYEILPEMGFKNHFYKTGFEADDVMASLVIQYDFELAVIMSNDNDMYQCIKDNVYVYNHKESALITADEFFDMYRMMPGSWAKIKTLAGCNSDKVPGVPGIKETRAIQYLLGELPRNGVAYQNILRALNTKEYMRDAKLVTLPLQQLNFDIQNDCIDFKKFVTVCKNYGLSRLIRMQEQNKWKILFNKLNN